MIVAELCDNGSMDNWLTARKKDSKWLRHPEMHAMARDICSGMQYAAARAE